MREGKEETEEEMEDETSEEEMSVADLSIEDLIISYCETFKIKYRILRLCNVRLSYYIRIVCSRMR